MSQIQELAIRLEKLSLNDCLVTLLNWNLQDLTFSIEIDDIYWNYEGLEEYPGKKPGCFVFKGVKKVYFMLEYFDDPSSPFNDQLSIEEMYIKRDSNGAYLDILTQTSDVIRIWFESAQFPDIEELEDQMEKTGNVWDKEEGWIKKDGSDRHLRSDKALQDQIYKFIVGNGGEARFTDVSSKLSENNLGSAITHGICFLEHQNRIERFKRDGKLMLRICQS